VYVVQLNGHFLASRRVDEFNEAAKKKGQRPQVMLLSTGVGALGLTLTGANRVIM
jgi:SNF2 family DNA or RNA helicase